MSLQDSLAQVSVPTEESISKIKHPGQSGRVRFAPDAVERKERSALSTSFAERNSDINSIGKNENGNDMI